VRDRPIRGVLRHQSRTGALLHENRRAPYTACAVTVDPADPTWFPFDLDLAAGNARFLRFGAEVLDQSVFLDHRIALVERSPVDVPLASLAIRCATPAWLFHTSFCCSTLLARALHANPWVEVLKEPFALRRLADAMHAGHDTGAALSTVVALLARPWHENSRTVIKPTHAALNLAPALLDATPGSRAVVLYSGLSDFLVSNLKKPPQTQEKVGRLAARLAHDAGFDAELLRAAEAAADWPGLVAVQWTAAIALAQRALRHAPSRVIALSDRELLADIPGRVAAVAEWLALPAPPEHIAARAAQAAGRHAKETDATYDAAQRAREAEQVRQHFAVPIEQAMAWARAQCAPLLGAGPLAAALR
jgi:hypothetical protein